MNRKMVILLASAFLLMSCVVAHRRGGGVEIIPILPTVLELDVDQPYYTQDGYYYFYTNDRWEYSRSRSGPWAELPRSHWPHETRWRGRDRRH